MSIKLNKLFIPAEGEISVPIKDYEDYYEITNYGRVIIKNKNKPYTEMGQRLINSGYYVVYIRGGRKRKPQLIHRLVAIHFIENTHNVKEVNHKDGNKFNNHFSNLEWVTPSQNIKLAYLMGHKAPRGSKSGSSKLNEDQAVEIYTSADRVYNLAKRYRISRNTINDIKSGLRWGHATAGHKLGLSEMSIKFLEVRRKQKTA